MDLRTLKIFIKVAEERHFAKVAGSLGMSPAEVSNAITRLEARYGVPLVARTTRSVKLTSEGQQFFESCKNALLHLEEAEMSLSKSHRTPRGKIRVRMPTGFSKNLFVPIIGKFLETYPDIVVEIEGSKAAKPRESPDLAIQFGKVTEPGLVARRLFISPLIVCGSPEYFAKHGRPRKPKDLETHKCISYLKEKSGAVADWDFKGDNSSAKQRIAPTTFDSRIFVDDVDLLVSSACAGLGLVQIVDYLVERELAEGKLETVLDKYVLPGASLNIVYQPHRFRSQKVRALIEFLSENVPKSARRTTAQTA